MRVPEETNRKIVDHISDINLTYSDIARAFNQEGIKSDRVIKVGSPCRGFKKHIKNQNSNILKTLKLKEKQYILVSCHREKT